MSVGPQRQAEGPPYQGELFSADALEDTNRALLGKRRIQTSGRGKVTKIRDRVFGGGSTIPTSHLQPRGPMRPEHAPEGRPETKMVFSSGQYSPERVQRHRTLDIEAMHAQGPEPKVTYKWSKPEVTGDVIGIPSTTGFDPWTTAVHELGHRHHFSQFPASNSPGLGSPANMGRADPLYEGIADAYVDRYRSEAHSSARGDIKRFETTGYSTDFAPKTAGSAIRGGGWSPEGRALYAMTRAHYGATGEIPRYQEAQHAPQESRPTFSDEGNNPSPGLDATIHHLLTHSPHAREALAQLTTKGEGRSKKRIPLLPVAEAASRRHQDRMLLHQGQNVQGSLFGEEHLAHNQFNEPPRSRQEVIESLSLRPPSLGYNRGLED